VTFTWQEVPTRPVEKRPDPPQPRTIEAAMQRPTSSGVHAAMEIAAQRLSKGPVPRHEPVELVPEGSEREARYEAWLAENGYTP